MDNRITKGSEGIPRNNIQQSYIPYPVNEDYSMIVEVLACTNNIITCQKVWDLSKGEKKIFHAYKIKGNVAVGCYIVVHRVGKFNSNGDGEPELNVFNPDGYSWIYLGFTPDSFIKDIGVVGKRLGWTVVLGGRAGTMPRAGLILEKNLSSDDVIRILKKFLEYYAKNAADNVRAFRFVERVGIDKLKEVLLS